MAFKAAVLLALAVSSADSASNHGEEHARRLQDVNRVVHKVNGLTKTVSRNIQSFAKQHRERRLNGIKSYWKDVEELGDFQDSWRRLSSPSFCTWADSACGSSDSWLTAKAASLPDTSMLKGEFTKYKACQSKAEGACNTGGCLWEEGQCEYSLPDSVTQRIMAKITTDDVMTKCGWVGSLFGGMKCEGNAASSCPAADKCATKTEKQPNGNVCEDVEICTVDESKTKNPMCPDATKTQDEMTQECMASGATGLIACLKDLCPVFGEMLEAYMPAATTCSALTSKTACDGNAKCKWGDTECGVSTLHVMSTGIPDDCAYKGFLEASATCDVESNDDCPTAKCQWAMELHCEDGMSECKGGCEPRSFLVLDLMVQASGGDAEVTALGEVEQQGRVCQSKDTEALCTAATETMKVNTTATGFGACLPDSVDEATRTYTTDVIAAASVALAAFVVSQTNI